ncbi:MAG: hypothetical protein AB7G93_16590 [Bdellovibrionales bacterium]
MQSKKYILGAICLALAGVIGYLAANRRSENLTATVVRTYKVAPERADEIDTALNRLFWQKEDEGVARAQVFGNGLVLVRAPAGYHMGVRDLLSHIDREKVPARSSVRTDYWLILADADRESNASQFPKLTQVLSSIEKLEGIRRFRVIEHLSSNSLSGNVVKVEGTVLKVRSTASLYMDRVLLDLDLETRSGKIKTSTQINPGEYVVMGQSSAEPGILPKGDPRGSALAAGDSEIYYVVRAKIQK